MLWQQKAALRGGIPARKDFDFYDFRTWLGRIFIARIEREPFNVRFVLWGTQLTEWWQVDYTNKLLGERSRNPELWNQSELRYFKDMDDAPFIGVACGHLDQHGRPHIKVLGLDLPLWGETGLSHVLSAHLQIEFNDTVADVLPDCPLVEYR